MPAGDRIGFPEGKIRSSDHNLLKPSGKSVSAGRVREYRSMQTQERKNSQTMHPPASADRFPEYIRAAAPCRSVGSRLLFLLFEKQVIGRQKLIPSGIVPYNSISLRQQPPGLYIAASQNFTGLHRQAISGHVVTVAFPFIVIKLIICYRHLQVNGREIANAFRLTLPDDLCLRAGKSQRQRIFRWFLTVQCAKSRQIIISPEVNIVPCAESGS